MDIKYAVSNNQFEQRILIKREDFTVYVHHKQYCMRTISVVPLNGVPQKS